MHRFVAHSRQIEVPSGRAEWHTDESQVAQRQRMAQKFIVFEFHVHADILGKKGTRPGDLPDKRFDNGSLVRHASTERCYRQCWNLQRVWCRRSEVRMPQFFSLASYGRSTWFVLRSLTA